MELRISPVIDENLSETWTGQYSLRIKESVRNSFAWPYDNGEALETMWTGLSSDKILTTQKPIRIERFTQAEFASRMATFLGPLS